MRYFVLLICFFYMLNANGQQIHRCGTDEAIRSLDHKVPGYQQAVEQTFRNAKLHAQRKDVDANDSIFRIPVVVHIVYNSPEENIPNELVYAQIARLNRDYRRLNADTTETRSEFLPVAADAGIEFYLAGVDPDGNPTGGITRTQTSRTDFAPDFFGGGLDEMKQNSTGGKDAWDTDNYLNIWVCDLIGSGSLFSILGFAYPPASAPNWPSGSAASSPQFEGVVIHYEVFGDGNPLAVGEMGISDMGRTAVHEVGHYLGLRHIWGDALFTDGCAEDDGIEDTPNASASAQQQCNFNSNSCVDSPVDFPDMIENYMDYARDECMNLFTQGQVDIMRSMLETARASLVDEDVAPSGIVSDRISADQVSVFPNPSNGIVELQCSPTLDPVAVRVVDASGRIAEVVSLSGGHRQNLKLNLNPGLYILDIEFEQGRALKRITVL